MVGEEGGVEGTTDLILTRGALVVFVAVRPKLPFPCTQNDIIVPIKVVDRRYATNAQVASGIVHDGKNVCV